MSAKNPFRIYRDRINALSTKAMRVHNMTDTWKIGEYCHKKLKEDFDPKIRELAEISCIIELFTNRKEQMDFETPDFFRDQDFKFVLRKNGKSECVMLQNVGLDEIPIIDHQKETNITAASKAYRLWRAHCDVVEPLLKQHPDWKWGDACDWLEKHTGFPDIKV